MEHRPSGINITRRTLIKGIAVMAFGNAVGQGFTNPVNDKIVIVEPAPNSGLFFYSPTIGAGNLVASWTAYAGTDKYGNTYPAGLSLSGEPILLYSGIPAYGNLILSLSPSAGTDVFGNLYPMGLNVTTGVISGSIISGGLFEGTDFLINSLGEFFYSSTLPSPLNANPYFTNGSATGWAAFNGTFTVTGSPPPGTPYPYAGKYINNGVTSGAMEESTPSAQFSITPNTKYVVSAWVYSSNATVQLGFDWTLAGTYVSTTTQNFTVPVNKWTLITASVTSPASGVNQAYARIGTATATGATIYAQAITAYPANSATLIFAIAGSSGTDPYGNAYTPGITATDYLISPNGEYYYIGAPKSGNPPVLVISNGQSLQDPYGNNYLPADILIDTDPYVLLLNPTSGSYIQIAPAGPLGAFMGIGTGDSQESYPSYMTAGISGSGAGRTLDTEFTAPRFATGNYGELLLTSQSEDKTTQGAYTEIGSSSGNALLIGDNASGQPLIEITANGTVWYPDRAQTDTANHTNANNGTQPLTESWTIPATDLQPGTIYEIEVPYAGTFETSQLELILYLNGAATTCLAGVGAAFFAAASTFNGTIRFKLECLTTGATGTCNLFADGGIGITGLQSSGTNNRNAYLNGNQLGVTINTTTANTLQIQSAWNAAVASQTITGYGSKTTRTGP